MRPEHEALARRAVACSRWRWMPGMLIADNGAGIRFLWEDDRYLHGMAAEVGGLWMRMGKDRERLPDLTDPATLGCLIELARRGHGPTTTAIASLDPNTGAVTDWYVGNNERVICYADDEIEAYVSALEAAP